MYQENHKEDKIQLQWKKIHIIQVDADTVQTLVVQESTVYWSLPLQSLQGMFTFSTFPSVWSPFSINGNLRFFACLKVRCLKFELLKTGGVCLVRLETPLNWEKDTNNIPQSSHYSHMVVEIGMFFPFIEK